VAVVIICMFRQYTCRKLGSPGGDLMATKWKWKPQISPLRYAPVEMTSPFDTKKFVISTGA